MKVSLVMSSFKRAKLLNLGLGSLAKQFINYDLEIIVINDGINDETKSICDKYKDRFNIKYVFAGQRNYNEIKFRSPSIALNIGIKQAKGDIIIFSCPEIYHLNQTINNIIEPMKFQKRIFSTHSHMFFDNTSVLTRLLLDDNTYKLTNRLLELQLENNTYRCEYSLKLPFCMGIYKKELIEIGGYDEDFTGWGADDDDLVNRLKLNGLKHIYTGAKIIHLYHDKQYDRENKDHSPEYQHNLKLFKERKNQIIRNKNREWGVIR